MKVSPNLNLDNTLLLTYRPIYTCSGSTCQHISHIYIYTPALHTPSLNPPFVPTPSTRKQRERGKGEERRRRRGEEKKEEDAQPLLEDDTSDELLLPTPSALPKMVKTAPSFIFFKLKPWRSPHLDLLPCCVPG